jgi:galactokinase
VLIVNSKVQHNLSDGSYARRRAECEIAAKTMGVVALRDATLPQLEKAAHGQLDPTVFRRARHVIREIARTRDAAAAIGAGDWMQVGKLMYESHASLRDDFQVSCAELDFLVELARSIGSGGRVIGSRMTGGGFGGCTVSLVRTEVVDEVARAIGHGYLKKTGIEPSVFASRPAEGACLLQFRLNG